MKLPCPSPMLFAALLLAWLTPDPARAQAPAAPRIERIELDAQAAHLSVSVPAGTRRLVVESTRRDDLQGWSPRVVRRLDGTAQTIIVDLATDAVHELVRVRAESDDPLAAFARARTNIAPTPLPAGASPMLRNGEVVFDSAGAPPASVTPNGQGGSQRAVTESDIWNRRGSRLYFFNQLRGLQSIDVSTPDAPHLLGTLTFPASGEQLYAPDDQHVVLLLREDCRGNGYAGAAVVIVDVSTAQPREVTRLPIAGRLFESRMVGSALYVASQTYEESAARNGVWETATVISSFDLANPAAPLARDSLKVPGSATVVTATSELFFVGLDIYQQGRPRTTELHALDISSPDGSVSAHATVTLDGWVRDKFKISFENDVLRVLVEDQEKADRWSPITRLSTWRLTGTASGKPERLGKLDLGAGENLFGTRFDGQRAYVVTFRRVDPLWIVDLADPAQPRILGELEIPGWSNYLHPLGDRLLTVGIDDTTNWRAAVQLFDVSNPAKPALLAKVPLGDQWSSSEANVDEKALGVFPADGLVLIPFTGGGTNGHLQGVQIIDLTQDALKARGTIVHPELTPRRSTILGNRVLSLSARELLTVDIADRDQPKVVASLELSRRVDRVVVANQHLLTFAGMDLQIAATSAPDAVLATIPLGKLPVLGAAARESRLYVLQGVPSVITWVQENPAKEWTTVTNSGQLQLRIFDLAGLPAVSESGQTSLDLEYTASGAFDALWPTDTTLVWAARQQGGLYYRYWLDVPMTIDVAPVPVAAGPLAAVSRGADSGASLAFDSRFAFWPGGWWGQPQTLLAFDVSTPATPAFRGQTLGTGGAVRGSRAFAGEGTVLFSEEFQESSVTGSNLVTWTESSYTLVTNRVIKTNIVGTPIQEWVTNTTKINESFLARSVPHWVGDQAAAGAFHTLVVDRSDATPGTVLTWGDSANRLNPDGTRRDPAVPEAVPLLSAAERVAAGTYHSLAILNGQVWTWQSIDLLSQPPTPDDVTPPVVLPSNPTPVSGVPLPEVLVAGHRHSLALAGHTVWSWGHNGYGQLGRPAAEADLAPAPMAGLDARAVAAGAYNSFVLLGDGTVAGFGRHDQGQLGGRPAAPGEAYARVALPPGTVGLSAGAYHGVALLADGSVWTWGRNKEGQLGRPEVFEPGAPAPVPGLPPIRSIAASALATLAVDVDGAVWIWGVLDPDTPNPRREPGQIVNLGPVRAVKAGRSHALVTLDSGEAFAFGNDDFGQLGNRALQSIEVVFPNREIVYQPIFTYVTNIVEVDEVRSQYTTREVSQWVPILQWWQRYALNVVDYAAGGVAPVVRPALTFPGELRGVAQGGDLLFSVAQKIEGTTNTVTREILDVSAYDGVAVFVGEPTTLATNYEVTSHVEATPDGHVLLAQGSWSSPDKGRLRLLKLDGTRLAPVADVSLPSIPQETQLLGSALLVRGSGTFEVWDVTSPAAPRSIPAIDHGCVWFSLRDATGSAETGWWVPGGEYGTLRLAPR